MRTFGEQELPPFSLEQYERNTKGIFLMDLERDPFQAIS